MTKDQIKSELIKELRANHRLAVLMTLHARHQIATIHEATYGADIHSVQRIIGQAQGISQFIKTLTKDDAALTEASEYDLLKGFKS